MTFDTWRSAVGGQWQRLVLYPGGLTALALLILGWGMWRLVLPPRSIRHDSARWPWRGADLVAVSGPLLVLALLPLPKAAELRSPLDLPTAWLLLDLPLGWAVARGWQARASQQLIAARHVLGWLVALPGLAATLAVCGAQTGTVTLDTLAALAKARPLGWLGLASWVVALLPALQLGPWAAPLGDGSLGLGLALRRVGHVGLLTVALLPVWPKISPDVPGWWAVVQRDARLPVLITAGMLWLGLVLLDRGGRKRSAVLWGRAVWLVAAGALLAILWQVASSG